jgi:hypothetical protein
MSTPMTQILSGADIRGYYQALGVPLPGWARHEAYVSCFADPDAHRNGDRRPSCSVNLEHGAWRCHGCGARGGAYDAAIARGLEPRAAMDLMISFRLAERRGPRLLAHRGAVIRARSRQEGHARPHLRPVLQVNESDIRHWQSALTEQHELIGRLTRARGWLYNTMLELGLGYDCGSITIPVRDEARHLIGLLRYRPWPKEGESKMHSAYGSRRGLLPHPAAESSKSVLLVEGEPDMIAARSRGLPAIALPGVDAWRTEWAKLFADREVTIVMDCDERGRRAAERLAIDLRALAEVTVTDLEPRRDDGYDLTGWLQDGKPEERIWR